MKWALIAIVFMACLYSAYMYGRETMYAEFVAASGGSEGSQIVVLRYDKAPTHGQIQYTADSICATCHKGEA